MLGNNHGKYFFTSLFECPFGNEYLPSIPSAGGRHPLTEGLEERDRAGEGYQLTGKYYLISTNHEPK